MKIKIKVTDTKYLKFNSFLKSPNNRIVYTTYDKATKIDLEDLPDLIDYFNLYNEPLRIIPITK